MFNTLLCATVMATGVALTAVVGVQDEDSVREVIARKALKKPGGGSHDIELRVIAENGDEDITVVLNGQEVEDNQIKIDDNKIIIFDRDGRELTVMPLDIVVDVDPGTWMSDWQERLPAWTDSSFTFSNQPGLTWSMGTEGQPPVMLGVHLDTPTAALQYHLDLDDSSTMLSAVYEGLPAHNAGLRQYDVIVKVDGEAAASQNDVRTALRNREPGDDITFTVIQEGEKKTIQVVLEEYDSSRLAQANVMGVGVPFPVPQGNNQFFGNIQTYPGVEGRFNLGLDTENGIVIAPGDDEQRIFTFRGGPPQRLMDSGVPAIVEGVEIAPQHGVNSRLDAIDARIARLEALLRKLADNNR